MKDLYATQRAMRSMRNAALARGVVALLDIGTSKIVCLVLRFDGERFEGTSEIGALAGQSSVRIIGAATTRSRGVRYGEVQTMSETERAIRTAVQGAQKMADVRVDHVIASFSGGGPRSYGLAGQVDIEDETVTEYDIAHALSVMDVPEYGRGREVLHAQPVNFAIDHRSGLSDPRGQIGQTLACDMHMLTVDGTAIQNIIHCIKRCDLEVAGLTSGAYMAGLSALVEDEQELGAACIDMGGGTTDVSIFMKKHMIFADCVPIGGDHVTSDISMGLQIPMPVAERLKTIHGGVIATGLDDRELIDLGGDSGDWEHDRRQVSRTELIGIIRPRVEEILEGVRGCLDAAGFGGMPSQKIVLTGGASQIPGLDTLAPKILGQNVRLGRPLRVRGLPQAKTGAAFASAVGLSLFAANPQDEWWDFEAPMEHSGLHSFKRAVRWFRANW